MIALVPQMKILVCVAPVDFGAGIDRLAAICRASLDADPFSGTVFCFRNRSGTAVKLFSYDGSGFWLLLKRLSRGKLLFWPTADAPIHPLTAHELAVLLNAGDPRHARFAEPWRKLALPA